MVINYKKINPNGFYLLKYLSDPSIRFIVLFGGSSSAKSFSVAQTFLLQTLLDGENSLVMRKVGASIKNTVYEDYRVAAATLGISHLFKFQMNTIKCVNGARIDFSGLDDSEKIKGISNYKRVQLEELSEFEEGDLKQIRKRLRGKEGQQIVCTFNPIAETHWIKKKWLDNEKWHDIPQEVMIGGKVMPHELTKVKSIKMNEGRSVVNPKTKEIETYPPNMVLIQTTYLNNFWVVGSPDGTYGYYDDQCVMDFEYDRVHDPDYYNVYALGEWGVIRTGSEFFHAFNIGVHSGEHPYVEGFPIHLTVDNNVLPYISVGYHQADFTEGKRMWQFAETTAEPPNNSVRKAAKLVAGKLRSLSYTDRIILHGDASSKAANTIDDDKRSFMDLFIDTLQKEGFEVEDRIGSKNPSVAMTGEFINTIWEGGIEGLSVSIDEGCSASIDDYQSVQKDANGAILKTKVKNSITRQSYEEHGHLSDTLRYFVHDICYEEYTAFSNRRKRNLYSEKGAFGFFNPDASYTYDRTFVYIMPDVEGRFYLVHAGQAGTKMHMLDLVTCETSSVSEMKDIVLAHEADAYVFESSQAYFQTAREIREHVTELRIKKEYSDMERRISATSDYIKENFLLSSPKLEEDTYLAFVTELLDYSPGSGSPYGASAVLSGLAYMAIKNQE